MIRKTLIALSAAAAISAGMAGLASTAEAKTSINIGVGFGTPFYPDYGYGYGGYPIDYVDDCGWHWVKWKKVWNAAHTHKVWKYKKVYSCY